MSTTCRDCGRALPPAFRDDGRCEICYSTAQQHADQWRDEGRGWQREDKPEATRPNRRKSFRFVAAPVET